MIQTDAVQEEGEHRGGLQGRDEKGFHSRKFPLGGDDVPVGRSDGDFGADHRRSAFDDGKV